MDAVFGPENFLNEITWKRTHAHGGANRYGPVHDTILFYARSDEYSWHGTYTPYSDDYVNDFFKFKDKDGRRYRVNDPYGHRNTKREVLESPGAGLTPPESGRHWAVPGTFARCFQTQRLRLRRKHWTSWMPSGGYCGRKKKGGTPSFKQYLDDMPGVPAQDAWNDISPISAQAAERLGYPRRSVGAVGTYHKGIPARKATSYLTPSVAVVRPWLPRRSSSAVGSASTSPTWPST